MNNFVVQYIFERYVRTNFESLKSDAGGKKYGFDVFSNVEHLKKIV